MLRLRGNVMGWTLLLLLCAVLLIFPGCGEFPGYGGWVRNKVTGQKGFVIDSTVDMKAVVRLRNGDVTEWRRCEYEVIDDKTSPPRAEADIE